ncbi:MAG: endonuclease III [Nitrososphaerota archaeon]
MVKLDIDEVFQKIKEMVTQEPSGYTALEEVVSRKRDPFKVLIAAILSHRTRDENTTKAVERLFSKYPSAELLARADVKTIEGLIRPAGFYRVKARRIKEVARTIVERHRGEVPKDLDELLQLPSVGRKTANCVLVYGYGIPAIPVDTHVHRISNRLGLVRTKSPDETEEALAKVLDRRYWLEVNELFVRFGQTVCRPKLPRCTRCLLSHRCPYHKKMMSGEVKEKFV